MAAKYVFVYLLTTPVSSLCGCFEIGFRRISNDTGLGRDSIQEAFCELADAGVIDTDCDTNEVLLVNWPKHNWNRSPKLDRPLADSISEVKSPRLRQILVEKYQNTRKIPYPYPIDTVSIPYEYPIDTPSIQYPYRTDTPTISIPISTTSSNGRDSIKEDSQGEIQPDSVIRLIDGPADFVAESLVIWNNVTGSKLRRFPDNSVTGLVDAYNDGRTLDDIRSVVEHVMTWEPRYRTPNGAFAGGKIEQWINRPSEHEPQRYPESSDCPECGSATPVSNGICHCLKCGITFKANSIARAG